MNAFASGGCLIAVNSLLFGFFVFLKNPASKFNRLWLAFAASVAFWGIGSTWIALETDPTRALWAWRLSFACSVVWIPILFFHFVCLFCEKSQPHLLRLSYATGIGFVPFILFSPAFFNGVRHVFSSFYYAVAGLLLVSFFTFLWIGLTVYSHYLLATAYQHAAGTKRAQIRYFFLATAFGYSGGSLEFLPFFGIDLYPWGHFAIAVYPIIMAYAIARYRLMDISLAFEKGVVYLILFSMGAIPLYGFLIWAQHTYFGAISSPFSLILLITFFLAGWGSYSLKFRAEDAVARTLFRHRYDTLHTIAEFSHALVTILEFQTLADKIVQTLGNILNTEYVALYLLEEGKSAFSPIASAGSPPSSVMNARFSASDELPVWLEKHHAPFVREEAELHASGEKHSILAERLRSLEMAVCLPFVTKGRLIGFSALGRRLSHQPYSDEELDLLISLSHNAAIALENAVMYEDLKKSQYLMQRMQHLRSLEIMAGGFAHEVRNPLTSIKTFIQLAPQRAGDREFLRKFGRVVTEDIARIERLTQEILDYSQRVAIRPEPHNLNEILMTCLDAIKLKSQATGICVVHDLAADLPQARLDYQQMQQVFLNLFLNALEAMNKPGGRLLVRSQCVEGSEESWIQVEVSDNGVGIPENEVAHVFDPFFTTKHKSQEREGTGLGLTIAHQIVLAHEGAIEVTSAVGKGTTFLVKLPIQMSPIT